MLQCLVELSIQKLPWSFFPAQSIPTIERVPPKIPFLSPSQNPMLSSKKFYYILDTILSYVTSIWVGVSGEGVGVGVYNQLEVD